MYGSSCALFGHICCWVYKLSPIKHSQVCRSGCRFCWGVSGLASTSGKLLWNGAKGWVAALKLLAIAEAANVQDLNTTGPIAWRRGILRPALLEKHAADFRKIKVQNVEEDSNEAGVLCLEEGEARALVPGLVLPDNSVALFMPHGLNLHPRRYLEALWMACQTFARKASSVGSPGTQAVLLKQHISTLSELSGYDAVVVCMGANVVMLPELAGKLTLSMCRGVVAQLHLPPSFLEYREEVPNLLSSTWLALQGQRKMVLGATKQWGCGNTSTQVLADEERAVWEQLIPNAEMFYPSIKQWEVTGLQAGVRAMPPRTSLGALPLAGCINTLVQPKLDTDCWLIGGLGSRGLIYHAWLGELVAAAIVSGIDTIVPQELSQAFLK
ncbi:hypothetical protein CY35_17G008100 [Sphagnum magellanicum]|nr:hypothetical protein CY35_17G008100 [Sphagnum magellanicum]